MHTPISSQADLERTFSDALKPAANRQIISESSRSRSQARQCIPILDQTRQFVFGLTSAGYSEDCHPDPILEILYYLRARSIPEVLSQLQQRNCIKTVNVATRALNVNMVVANLQQIHIGGLILIRSILFGKKDDGRDT